MAAEMRHAAVSPAERGVRPVLLVVEDDPGVRDAFRLVLEDRYDLLEAPDGPRALELARSAEIDCVLLDIRLPGMDGIEVLERLKTIDEQVEVILVTAVKTVRSAVAAMKLGAFDYLAKPFDEDELLSLLRRALEKRSLEREVAFLRSELARRDDGDAIVGRHAAMQQVLRLVNQVARTMTTVLITGESGTGKELIARAIHRQGPRRDGPFVAVNPAAIVEGLIESELFGHEKGAFTGAHQRKIGRFEMAQGGTLFLDEIATLQAALQAKLLRVLQEREIERVGGTRAIKIDARIIAATNVDLKAAIEQQTFREDLYYRLNVMPIAVPPLRERRDDVPLLVDHFLQRYRREFNKPVGGVSPEAVAALVEYPWPGNVRELQNVIERSMVLAEGPVIGLADLPLDVVLSGRPSATAADALPLNEATEHFERQMVLRVLERVGWNLTHAGRILGLHRNSLRLKLTRWNIAVPAREEPTAQ
jgi:two-component system response regulator AtoC